MPPDEIAKNLRARRWGLRYSSVEGVVCLIQIAGGGRLRLKCGGREWWSRPPSGARWEPYRAFLGQTYETREDAEEVIANLTR